MNRFRSHDPRVGYQAMNVIMDEEAPGSLWLGDYTAAQDHRLLKEKGIKTVLTVAQGLNISYPQNSNITHKVNLQINPKTYNIFDVESADISKIWNDTFTRIDEGLQKGGVLVHCAAGISRSASTVIAYLMRKKRWGFNETLNYVRNRRSVICPNFGFQKQLRSFERQLKQSDPQPPPLEQKQHQSESTYSPTKEQQKKTYLSQMQQTWAPDILNKEVQTFEKIPLKTVTTPTPIQDLPTKYQEKYQEKQRQQPQPQPQVYQKQLPQQQLQLQQQQQQLPQQQQQQQQQLQYKQKPQSQQQQQQQQLNPQQQQYQQQQSQQQQQLFQLQQRRQSFPRQPIKIEKVQLDKYILEQSPFFNKMVTTGVQKKGIL